MHRLVRCESAGDNLLLFVALAGILSIADYFLRSAERRVSVVSSAAVSRRGDRPFSWLARDCRVLNKNDRDLVMTHVAVEYDRIAWQLDLNTIIPLDRLEEMAEDGEIGSVADEHFTFMGAADPIDMEASARATAKRMKQDNVNTVFLIPV